MASWTSALYEVTQSDELVVGDFVPQIVGVQLVSEFKLLVVDASRSRSTHVQHALPLPTERDAIDDNDDDDDDNDELQIDWAVDALSDWQLSEDEDELVHRATGRVSAKPSAASGHNDENFCFVQTCIL
eukprot:6492477-Amphidinium_carterae.1